MPSPATVATELLTPCLRELERLGPEVAARASESGLELLADSGLPLSSFSDLAQRIPHPVALSLLDNAVRVSGDPAFALQAGARVQRGDFGVVDLVSLSAPTLGASMQLAARYLPLLHEGASIEIVEQSGLALWKHCMVPGLSSSVAANEYVVAAFFFAARRAIGFDAPPLEVCFMHEAPTHRAVYERLFDAPLRFACETNAIVLPRVALELPLVGSDPVLHAVLLRHAADLLEHLPRASPFTENVRALMRAQLEHGASLDTLAAALHLSASTLQRRLQTDGTTHTELLDAVRRERATELLARTDLNVSEVAYRLGFAHRPAFHRAFKRWFGLSPKEHRERHTHSPFYRFHRRAER